METQSFIWQEIELPPGLVLERKKQQQQHQVFFKVILGVYTRVDNRVRASLSD